MNNRRNPLLRCSTRLLCGFGFGFLISCGGGISGSGNGGGSSNPDIPPAEEKYNIEFLPLEMSPALPASLARNSDKPDWFDNQSPAQSVAYGIANTIDNKVALGMMQLYIDSAWTDILEYCDVQQAATLCSLQNSGLSIAYTESMALWEIDLRNDIETEKLGLSSEQSAQNMADIKRQVTAKIGSQVQLDSVVFEKLDDQTFDYLVTMQIDELTPLRCALSWDNSKQLVTTSVATEPGANTASLYESKYDNRYGNSEFELSQTQTTSGREVAIQAYISEIPDTDEYYLQTTLTQTTMTETSGIESRGQIAEQQAYLFSESTVTAPGSESTILYREVFGAAPIATATCDPLASTSNCVDDSEWTTVLGNDPTTSELYLSNEQLAQYLNIPDDMTLSGVSAEFDSFLLLDGERIIADIPNKQLTISIEGLTLEWPLEEQEGEKMFYVLPDFQTLIFLELIICSASRSGSEDVITAACGIDPQEMRNALVVAEDITPQGQLKIILEKDAVVTPF